METKDLCYRGNEFFNSEDAYLFEDLGKTFESKVHFEKGYWWTNEKLNFKATTLRCKKLTLKTK